MRKSDDVIAALLLELPGQHRPGLHVVGEGHLTGVDRGQGVQPFFLNEANLKVS